jgi:hypothetical protein
VLSRRPGLLPRDPTDSAAECGVSAPSSMEVFGTDADALSPEGSIRVLDGILSEVARATGGLPMPLRGVPDGVPEGVAEGVTGGVAEGVTGGVPGGVTGEVPRLWDLREVGMLAEKAKGVAGTSFLPLVSELEGVSQGARGSSVPVLQPLQR